MRLLSITISGFKNLSDLSFDFESEYDVYVMLGGNGTGKSNLIEAIVAIFADVDLRRKPKFGYCLRYLCRGLTVQISGSTDDELPTVHGNGQPLALPSPNGAVPDWMPDHIIAYYSGPGSRLESHFVDHARREMEMLRDPTRVTYSPFLYCDPIYSDFLLLACFASGAFKIREFVSGRMGIEKIESVLLDIVKPYQRPTRSTQLASQDGDDRFWSATGEIAEILELLWNNALAPYFDKSTDASDFPGAPKRQHLYLFLKDQDALKSAAKPFGASFGFFRHLCYLHTMGMVHEVTTMIHRRGCQKPISYSQLSEGERQLITIVGLLNMVRGGENLVLLDEPDTHLNPRWKYEYLQILRQYSGDVTKNQLLIATHDPLLIGELKREQVFAFQQDREAGRISIEHPIDDPIGQGIAGLLKSELFGLRSTVDQITIGKVDRRYELYAKGNDRTPEQTAEMHELIGELSRMGFTTEFQDPYYEQFVQAMARRKEFQKPVLSAKEREEQEEIADKILDEILGVSE